jgi:hypothetical protein
MKLGNNLIAEIPKPIYKQCQNFVKNYKEENTSILNKYTHNKEWKENNNKLKKITTDILKVV